MNYSSRSTVKPPHIFEVFGQIGQGQSKILAKMSAVIGAMQCSNKKIFGQDFDRGRRSKYTAYTSATPLNLQEQIKHVLYSILFRCGNKFMFLHISRWDMTKTRNGLENGLVHGLS